MKQHAAGHLVLCAELEPFFHRCVRILERVSQALKQRSNMLDLISKLVKRLQIARLQSGVQAEATPDILLQSDGSVIPCGPEFVLSMNAHRLADLWIYGENGTVGEIVMRDQVGPAGG